MAHFQRGGRGGRSSRGGRGRGSGRSRFSGGATRGGINKNDRLARSGIRTAHGYRKFDSQRVKDASDVETSRQLSHDSESDSEDTNSSSEEEPDEHNGTKPYNALLQAFRNPELADAQRFKRRKIEDNPETLSQSSESNLDEHALPPEEAEEEAEGEAVEDLVDEADASSDEEGGHDDPYQVHFAQPSSTNVSQKINAVQAGSWDIQKHTIGNRLNLEVFRLGSASAKPVKHSNPAISSLHLKQRLAKGIAINHYLTGELANTCAPYMFDYADLLVCNRTIENAPRLRKLASLHAVNHILKGRDRVLKNNAKLSNANASLDLECRDQGFVRPKVLMLLETRQLAAKYADSIVEVFQPEQQENRKRFDDAFTLPIDERDNVPDDFRELFDGNNDNSFVTALKFTRKTLKFYSPFYSSDIIIASPLGLRRIIEHEDSKKRDHDFLSSIEVVVVDQADAMQMQSWENVDTIFKHLNLDLKEAHGCDFSRVRPWYLDGNAKYMRQTLLFCSYITPEINRLFNCNMLNIAGKVKCTRTYRGAITGSSGMDVKQTFSRFQSASPSDDPDARFKYFTTAIIPGLLRLPQPPDGAMGVLVFIPSYYDFLRLRNYFATSTQTENVSFGAIHDYNDISEQRRARSHFLSGRHSILLYTQRAHHFFRLKIRGVKRVIMYGLPENPIFYQEMVEGFLGTSLGEGRVESSETGVRSLFSKWDGLKLERIAGSARIGPMMYGAGDTFEFL